jgi:hypothetical protein
MFWPGASAGPAKTFSKEILCVPTIAHKHITTPSTAKQMITLIANFFDVSISAINLLDLLHGIVHSV